MRGREEKKRIQPWFVAVRVHFPKKKKKIIAIYIHVYLNRMRKRQNTQVD